jgi:hypothetical protein
MPVTLRLDRGYARLVPLLAMAAADGFASHMPLPFAGATGWFCDEGPDSDYQNSISQAKRE